MHSDAKIQDLTVENLRDLLHGLRTFMSYEGRNMEVRQYQKYFDLDKKVVSIINELEERE